MMIKRIKNRHAGTKSSTAPGWPLYLLLCAFWLLTGCGPNTGFLARVDRMLVRQQYGAALKLFEDNKNSYSGREKVLYYLDRGAVAHYGGYWQESIDLLSRADSLIEQAYTRSVSREAATFLINDNLRNYPGEDFESALVNLFQALNYAALGMWEDALVEARRVDIKLNLFNDQYPEHMRNVYREDAFIRFLMGLLYESQGELNDAFIEYKKALEIYRELYQPVYGVAPPPVLARKALAAANVLDFQQQARQLKEQYPELVNRSDILPPAGLAEVVMVHYNGPGAEKKERSLWIKMPDGYLLKLAYPVFVNKPYCIAKSRLVLTGTEGSPTRIFDTAEVENISAIAKLNLKNRIARIKTKAIARLTAKYLAAIAIKRNVAKESNRNWGLLAHLITQTALLATENADTRQWRMLPATIRLAVARIEPGTWQGNMEFFDTGGKLVAKRKVARFTVMPGQKFFLVSRTVQ